MTTKPAAAPVEARIRTAFRVRGVWFWLLGGGFALTYQVPTLIDLWTSSAPVHVRVYGTVILAFVFAAFLVLPPILWASSRVVRWCAVVGYGMLTLALIPLLHSQIVWVWILVVGVAAVVFESPWEFFPLLAVALLGMQVFIFFAEGEPFLYISVLVTASVGIVMHIMNRQLATLRSLRAANAEIARLAVVEERARFSRDLHDVLGHSLTVVAVKSELAAKLVDRDPARTRSELADIERLSRDALSDLRAAVSNYREMSLDTELVSAGRALAAAGIRIHMPSAAPEVPPEVANLFGWVIREGVTNVIRHSGARHCAIEISPRYVRVTDDGTGGETAEARAGRVISGNGLRGLRERAASVGATISAGPLDSDPASTEGDGGGFRLEATVSHE